MARLGGDEFTILVEDIRDPSDAVRIAERIQRAVAVPVSLGDGQEVFTSASVGIAIGTSVRSTDEELVRDADIAMYRAKASGGDRCAIFDATMHEQIELVEGNRRLLLAQGFDARFTLCERPMILVGGELTMEMLDVQFSAATSEYTAPLQMKANGGILVIDDLGRQRFVPQRLFDRWTVPLEQQIDHLSAGADALFATPCDAVIVFATNLDPADLTDEAVHRRLGYKIQLGPLSIELYTRVWTAVCAEMGVAFDQKLLNYALSKLYPPSGRPLLACHPRDLICMALDKAAYDERGVHLQVRGMPAAIERLRRLFEP